MGMRPGEAVHRRACPRKRVELLAANRSVEVGRVDARMVGPVVTADDVSSAVTRLDRVIPTAADQIVASLAAVDEVVALVAVQAIDGVVADEPIAERRSLNRHPRTEV